MSNIPAEQHHCWVNTCKACGAINRGCLRFNIKCHSCNERLEFDDVEHGDVYTFLRVHQRDATKEERLRFYEQI